MDSEMIKAATDLATDTPLKPRIFFDTNICINAANGTIPQEEWKQVRSHIAKHFRYCISFITLKELFGKLARGGDIYFETNKRPLKVMLEAGNDGFLAYPAVSVLRVVLGIPSLSRTSDYVTLPDEEWSEKVLTAVLQAPSKAQLKSGIPLQGHPGCHQTFDLDHFDQHENQPQTEYADINQGLREGYTDMPEPDTWCKELCKPFGHTPTPEQLVTMKAVLDAAYTYQCKLSGMSKNKNYDFHSGSNVTAWGDVLQLFYLHDDSTYFLTTDKDFQSYCQGSTQRNRILFYSDFAETLPTF
jgi:hypothetical protein